MSHIAKLNLKAVHRNVQKDPVVARRDKLLLAIEEQGRVLAAALAGNDYTVKTKRWHTNDAGERTLVEHEKRVRAWFFEQDGGWYVQCKYGARTVQLDEKCNSVFVKKINDVAQVLEVFYAACAAGEFDAALSKLAVRNRK